jgi:hypothetical protein
MFPFPVLAWLGTVLLVPLVIVPNGDDHLLAYRWLAWAGLTLGLFVSPQQPQCAVGAAGGALPTRAVGKGPAVVSPGQPAPAGHQRKFIAVGKSFGRAARPVR